MRTAPTLLTSANALAARILFEGKKAAAVEYSKGGEKFRATANREIILSGGSFLLYSNGTTAAWGIAGTYNLIQYAGAPGVAMNFAREYRPPFRLRMAAW